MADHRSAGCLTCRVPAARRFLDRAKVTANVVDIESDTQTVLHAASVSELGDGNVEVMHYEAMRMLEWADRICARRVHPRVARLSFVSITL